MEKEEVKKVLIKSVVIGSSRVGKTALINNFVTSKFSQNYKVTIGADFFTKEIDIGKNVKVALQMWDTAGQEKYASLGRSFYHGAESCVIVFDITDIQSFEKLDFWKHQFLEEMIFDSKDFPFVVIGSKVDLESERRVPSQKALQWCKENGNLPYFEISSKQSINIAEAFQCISTTAYSYHCKHASLITLPQTKLKKRKKKPSAEICKC